jgi:hypothetical protein
LQSVAASHMIIAVRLRGGLGFPTKLLDGLSIRSHLHTPLTLAPSAGLSHRRPRITRRPRLGRTTNDGRSPRQARSRSRRRHADRAYPGQRREGPREGIARDVEQARQEAKWSLFNIGGRLESPPCFRLSVLCFPVLVRASRLV